MTEPQVFLTLALAHLIAVVSPGPDFAIILRHSIREGFAATVPMAIGIGSGILLHVFYSIMGIGIIIATNAVVFNIFKAAGAGYMLYLAYNGWRTGGSNPMTQLERQPDRVKSKDETQQAESQSRKSDVQTNAGAKSSGSAKSKWGAYRVGFLTNALNVKATIFFLSVYLLIAGQSPLGLQILYGIYLATATGVYFILLALLLGGGLRQLLHKYLAVIERASALLLGLLAILLLLYNQPILLP